MTAMRSIVLLALVVVGVTVAPVASAAVATPVGDEDRNDGSAANTSVTDFIHASTADAENTVDSGMFEARYDAEDDESRQTLVVDRTASIEDRLTTLEAERDELRERKDELSAPKYRARLTKLTVEIAALERSIERTRQRGLAVGLEEARFETIRQNASALATPEIESAARGLAGFDRQPGGGPFGDHGPPGDSPGGPPGDGGPSDESPGGPGQWDDEDDESDSNETEREPPGDDSPPVEPPGP